MPKNEKKIKNVKKEEEKQRSLECVQLYLVLTSWLK